MELWLLFLFVGGVMVFLEIFIPGVFISILGLALMIFSVFLYFFPDEPVMYIFGAIVSGVAALLAVKAYMKFFSSRKPSTGVESLIGNEAIVVKKIVPDEVGQVKAKSEVWSAYSDESKVFNEGVKVIIKGYEGVKLLVGEKK